MVIAYGPEFAKHALLSEFQRKNITLLFVTKPSDLDNKPIAALIMDKTLLDQHPIAHWRQAVNNSLIIAEQHCECDCDLLISNGWPRIETAKALQLACKYWHLQKHTDTLQSSLDRQLQQSRNLTDIGIALSAEKNLDQLLSMVLSEGRRLACCDGASLFLIDQSDPQAPQLVFKLTQNDSIDFDFQEHRVPLDQHSLAGFVALTGEVLIIEDAYTLPESVPYRFNPDFDQATGYRTTGILILPMCNYKGEVIGVLQFLNRKSSPDVVLQNTAQAIAESRPFDSEIIALLRSLASQAAVAIDNNLLLDNIHKLFEGFVSASVMAIEQRDSATAGHSFRVADMTTGLATALPKAGLPAFRDHSFSRKALKEIRYAALLHDFGKVGVREHILLKPKKLPEGRLQVIRYRIALEKERLQRQHFEHALQGRHSSAQQLQLELQRLDEFLQVIISANEPSVLPEGEFAHLMELRDYRLDNLDNHSEALISQEDFLALSVRKGSLTELERNEIQSHVVHTYNFLNCIPWTAELKQVPIIAAAHHEKLDGSGYPWGLKDEDIPLPSKLMTIADIYDALTAIDRPYKTTMPVERALDILQQEAKTGQLSADLVQVFIAAKVYTQPKQALEYTVDHHGEHC